MGEELLQSNFRAFIFFLCSSELCHRFAYTKPGDAAAYDIMVMSVFIVFLSVRCLLSQGTEASFLASVEGLADLLLLDHVLVQEEREVS